MRKYLVLASIAFSERLAYPGEALSILGAAGVRAFTAWLLWSVALGGRGTAAGMDRAGLVAYYLVASALRGLDRSEGHTWEFAGEIRSGNFAKYLARPLDPRGCFLAVSAGRSAFQALVLAAAGLAASLVLGPRALPDPLGLLLLLPVLLLGLLCLALLNYLTALLAFAFQDIAPFHMVKNQLVDFLSGILVPLALFPPLARAALAWTPFPALASLPARLWAGEGAAEVPRSLAVLALWALLLLALSGRAGERLAARYEEAGS